MVNPWIDMHDLFPRILVGSSRPNFENKAAGKLLYSTWKMNGMAGTGFSFVCWARKKKKKKPKHPPWIQRFMMRPHMMLLHLSSLEFHAFHILLFGVSGSWNKLFYPAGILISSILYPQLLVNLNTTILLMTVTAIFNCDRSLIRNIQIARRGRVLVGVGDGG